MCLLALKHLVSLQARTRPSFQAELDLHTVADKIKSSSGGSVTAHRLGNAIDSGMGLSITIDKFRVFIYKTLSILSVYQ